LPLTKKTLMAYMVFFLEPHGLYAYATHKAPTCLAYLHLQLASKLKLNLNIGQTNWDILGLSYKLKPSISRDKMGRLPGLKSLLSFHLHGNTQPIPIIAAVSSSMVTCSI